MNYQVGDFIIRIKNAVNAKRKIVVLPYSKLNKSIGEILVQNGYLDTIKEDTVDEKKELVGTIGYKKRFATLTDVRIVSKPSLRVYIQKDKIRSIERRGNKTTIISTSQGVMTGKEAQKKGLGGELLFEIW